ncbi:unnamed protein product [Boreogadus saida]
MVDVRPGHAAVTRSPKSRRTAAASRSPAGSTLTGAIDSSGSAALDRLEAVGRQQGPPLEYPNPRWD